MSNFKEKETREYADYFGISLKDAFTMLEGWNYSSVLWTYLSQMGTSEIEKQIGQARRFTSDYDPLRNGVVLTRARKIRPCKGGGHETSRHYSGQRYYKGRKSALCELC